MASLHAHNSKTLVAYVAYRIALHAVYLRQIFEDKNGGMSGEIFANQEITETKRERKEWRLISVEPSRFHTTQKWDQKTPVLVRTIDVTVARARVYRQGSRE